MSLMGLLCIHQIVADGGVYSSQRIFRLRQTVGPKDKLSDQF